MIFLCLCGTDGFFMEGETDFFDWLELCDCLWERF